MLFQNIGRYVLFIFIVQCDSQLLHDKANKNCVFQISSSKHKVIQNKLAASTREHNLLLCTFVNARGHIASNQFGVPTPLDHFHCAALMCVLS